jgi:hypothetical protein
LLVGLAVTSTAIAWRMLDVGYKLKT